MELLFNMKVHVSLEIAPVGIEPITQAREKDALCT